jgi:hypothetical protein
MNAPQTPAERQRKRRALLKSLQLQEVRNVFAHSKDHPAIKKAAAKTLQQIAKDAK